MTQFLPTPETGKPFVVSFIVGQHVSSLMVLAESRDAALKAVASLVAVAQHASDTGGMLLCNPVRPAVHHG